MRALLFSKLLTYSIQARVNEYNYYVMKLPKGRGQIFNHASVDLLVIENGSGEYPPIVHRLGPKRKSPDNLDADGFKRADGKSILKHKSWWKVPNFFAADIYQLGSDFLVPISVMIPVPDNWFGAYKMAKEKDWGTPLVYVTEILRDKYRKTTGYVIEGRDKIDLKEAIRRAEAGQLDNVVIVRHKNGNVFLRTKKNTIPSDNLA